MNSALKSVFASCLAIAAGLIASPVIAADLGLFSADGDIGTVSRPGTVAYDSAKQTYTVGASGVNMWFTKDAMHYVWKQVSGDVAIAADIAFLGDSKQPHRKACLVIRQSLEPGSAYVDVARHGDGLTSLQFREVADGPTKEIQSNVTGPARVRLDKIGDTIYLSVAKAGEAPHPSGASFKLPFHGSYYVGLAVSAHDDAAFESAVFSRVTVGEPDPAAAVPQPNLKVITLPSGDRRVSER
jgi:hypothetical protein